MQFFQKSVRLKKFCFMNYATILLGSNQGDRRENLKSAVSLLVREGSILRSSNIYETEPWGEANQPDFFNQVIEFATPVDAQSLMHILLDIEKKSGRHRVVKWAPRIIDLDILYFNEEIIREENLVIPHPQLHNRRFTLVPLAEIFPHKIHPVLKMSSLELLKKLTDNLRVDPIKTGVSTNG